MIEVQGKYTHREDTSMQICKDSWLQGRNEEKIVVEKDEEDFYSATVHYRTGSTEHVTMQKTGKEDALQI